MEPKNPRGMYRTLSGDAWQETVLEYTQYRVPARPNKVSRPAPNTFYPPPLRVTQPPVEIKVTPARAFPALKWLDDWGTPAQAQLRPAPSVPPLRIPYPIYLDSDLPHPHFLRWFFAPIYTFFTKPFVHSSHKQVPYAKQTHAH